MPFSSACQGKARKQIQQHAVWPTALAMQVDKGGRARVGVQRGPAGGYATMVEFGTVHMKGTAFMTSAAHAEEEPYWRRLREAGKALEQALAIE